MDVLDFVKIVNPRYERPEHLAPIAAVLMRALREGNIEAGFSAPPQHGKSELIFAFIALFMAIYPWKRNAYASYSSTIAERKSAIIQQYCTAAGVQLDPNCQSKGYWKTKQGGSFIATGVGGPLTSEGIDGLLIVDDPTKNRQEAESVVRRENTDGWLTSTAYSRRHPGSSTLINHTRWHEDDTIGRKLAKNASGKFIYVNLPAIDHAGNALWPSQRPLEWLQGQREAVGDYDWESLYMGNPRSRGAKVFRDSCYYIARPRLMRVAIGVDCAYTASTRADRSVAVVMAECDGKFYVLDVWSGQVEAPAFAHILKGLIAAWPGAPMLWYGSGTEKGVAQHIQSLGIPLQFEIATPDKLVRAQPVAGAWNRGAVLLPGEDDRSGVTYPTWLVEFVRVINNFTGVKDKQDDEVDALAAAYDLLVRGMGTGRSGTRGSRTTEFGGY